MVLWFNLFRKVNFALDENMYLKHVLLTINNNIEHHWDSALAYKIVIVYRLENNTTNKKLLQICNVLI